MTRTVLRNRPHRVASAAVVLLAYGAAAAQPPAGYELALVDMDGNREVLTILPGNVFAPRVSPDGSRVAYETIERMPERSVTAQLWVAELANPAAARPLPMMNGPMNWAPMWTANGEQLVYVVSGERPDALYMRRADGTGDSRHLIDARSAEVQIPESGRLTFLTLTGNGDYGISTVDMHSRAITKLVDLPGTAQHSSNVSPDGRRIAYASNETGRYEVWVEPLPPTGQRLQVTRGGGGHPLWSRDGAVIFFDRDHQLFSIEVNTATPTPTVGEERALPITGFVQGEYRRQFELMPNGRQFMMLFTVP